MGPVATTSTPIRVGVGTRSPWSGHVEEAVKMQDIEGQLLPKALVDWLVSAIGLDESASIAREETELNAEPNGWRMSEENEGLDEAGSPAPSWPICREKSGPDKCKCSLFKPNKVPGYLRRPAYHHWVMGRASISSGILL